MNKILISLLLWMVITGAYSFDTPTSSISPSPRPGKYHAYLPTIIRPHQSLPWWQQLLRRFGIEPD